MDFYEKGNGTFNTLVTKVRSTEKDKEVAKSKIEELYCTTLRRTVLYQDIIDRSGGKRNGYFSDYSSTLRAYSAIGSRDRLLRFVLVLNQKLLAKNQNVKYNYQRKCLLLTILETSKLLLPQRQYQTSFLNTMQLNSGNLGLCLGVLECLWREHLDGILFFLSFRIRLGTFKS